MVEKFRRNYSAEFRALSIAFARSYFAGRRDAKRLRNEANILLDATICPILAAGTGRSGVRITVLSD